MSDVGAPAYPVQFAVDRSRRYQRVQVLLRLGVWIILGWVGNVGLGVLFLLAPVISAMLIAQRGGAAFLERYGGRYRRALSFYLGVNAYLWFATDTFPTWGEEGPSRLGVQTTGTPTVGSALLRIILVIPHMLVLLLLSIVAGILGLIAAISVLWRESVPGWICDYETAFLAWQARTLAYFVSMVEEYPPFSFSTFSSSGDERGSVS